MKRDEIGIGIVFVGGRTLMGNRFHESAVFSVVV